MSIECKQTFTKKGSFTKIRTHILIFFFSLQSVQWVECLLNTIANENFEIVLRGCVIVKNMISSGKDIAEKVLETQLMDCMQAHIFKAKRK